MNRQQNALAYLDSTRRFAMLPEVSVMIQPSNQFGINTGSYHAAFRLGRMLFAVALLFSSVLAQASDQIPGKPQQQPVAIVGATLHTVEAGDVQGTIVFDDGKIKAIGSSVVLPPNCKIVQADGKHVYPSLVEANSDIGLVEINSVRASLDSREVGEFNPNVRAVAAFNPDSELIPVNRSNGILLAVTAPRGGIISGRSSLMLMDGWTWEDMTLASDIGMQVGWSTRESELEEIEAFFDQCELYARSDGPRDLRLEAMQPVLSGDLPLIVSANSAAEIRSSIGFAKKRKLKLILLGASDALQCADLIRATETPIIIAGVYRTPRRRHEPYDGPYALPSKLAEQEIAFCISAGGRFGASGIRNLPYHAGTAVGYGLDATKALEAITLAPAKILGVEDRVGSLAVGKDATLFIADGNILETPTQVEAAYIQGRTVDLDNKHRQLFRKYSSKYE
ncbi:MAG: amidohydrolase family protein [Aureliella sp.]